MLKCSTDTTTRHCPNTYGQPSAHYAVSFVMAWHIFLCLPQYGNVDVFYNGLLLWFNTPKSISLLSALQWAGTGEKKKNSLTKENICIKWKADEKICNYVPDWVKYFSASKCKLPLEPVPNGRLPGLGKAPENVTSVWYRLPPQLPFLRSTASASPRVTLPSLIRSAPPCVPDNGAQLLSGKGSVATRE